MDLSFIVILYFLTCFQLVRGLSKNVVDEEITQLNYTIKKYIVGTGTGDQDFFWNVNLTDKTLGSYQIKVVTLDLDSSSGDFVLIKASPQILNEESIEGKIPPGPGIFLSDHNPVELTDTVNIVAPNGSLIYFHFHDPPGAKKNKRNNQNATLELQLSKIVYESEDEDSTNRPIPTDPPSLDHFIEKNLTGITPNDFVKSLSRFQSVISNITNEFRIKNNISDIHVEPKDVWIPLKEGVYYCLTNTGKSEIKHCVKVKYSVLTKDPQTGETIYTNEILKDIWNEYKDRLASFGYVEKVELTNTKRDEQIGIWVWIASSMGILLLFSTILCIAWLRNIDENQSENSGFEAMSETGGSSTSGTIVEQKNPIYGLIGKMIAKKEEQQKAYRELSQTNLAYEDDENVEFDISNLNSIKESWRNVQSRSSIVSQSGITETST